MSRNIFNEYVDPYIQSFIIPYKYEEIGKNVFSDCKCLEKLYIPWYVINIPENNFVANIVKGSVFSQYEHYQYALTIYGEKGTAAETCACNARVGFIEADRWIKGNRLVAYFGKSSKVIISDKIETIGFRAFQYAPHVSSVEIPHSVGYIDSEAFMGCKLEAVKIPAGVKALGSRVFKDCSELKCVTFENGKTILDIDCFSDCSNEIEIKAPGGDCVEEYAKKYNLKFTATSSI